MFSIILMKNIVWQAPLLFILLSCTPNSSQSRGQSSSNTMYTSFSSAPSTLHPVRSSDSYSSVIQSYVIENLLDKNIDNLELEPRLAVRWKINNTKRIYTFYLRKGVYWSDGKPLTAKDVQFSFKAFTDHKYGGVRWHSYFANISKVKILDTHTVQFFFKDKKFGTFDKIATFLQIIPEHIYKDHTKKLSYTLVGTGPYVLSRYNKNNKIVLEKNKKWWGNSIYENRYLLPRIVYRFIRSSYDQIVRFTRGRLDFIGLSAESFFYQTNGENWGQSFFKRKVENSAPKGYTYIGWNLRKDLFGSRLVRRGLSHLVNRTLMNNKFNNGASLLSVGPVHPFSDYADSSVKPVLFSPKKAASLFRKAGWRDSDNNGILDKKIRGRKREFKFTILFPNKNFEKYLTIYQQDLKRNGIIMDLKLMEWTSFLKLLDDKKFDAVFLGWSGQIDWYPKQIWHSTSMKQGGSNYIGYNSKKIDQWIDQADQELDRRKRIQALKKVYRQIVYDQPYTFMFTGRYSFYAHSKRIKMPKPTYKYKLGRMFWWID